RLVGAYLPLHSSTRYSESGPNYYVFNAHVLLLVYLYYMSNRYAHARVSALLY
ncbi:hypothetical protein BHE74_00019808, partial [Ensete ventricosum]